MTTRVATEFFLNGKRYQAGTIIAAGSAVLTQGGAIPFLETVPLTTTAITDVDIAIVVAALQAVIDDGAAGEPELAGCQAVIDLLATY